MDLVFTGIVWPGEVGNLANDMPEETLRNYDVTGCKVFVGHDVDEDGTNFAGRVIETHHLKGDGPQPKLVTAILDGHTPSGKRAIDLIESGQFLELSLTNKLSAYRLEVPKPDGTKGVFVRESRRPIELSIVQKGNKPNCYILHHHRDKSGATEQTTKASDSFQTQVFKNMADSAQSTVTPPAAGQPSAQSPPAEQPAQPTGAQVPPDDETSPDHWIGKLGQFSQEQAVQLAAESAAAKARMERQHKEQLAELEKIRKENEELKGQAGFAQTALKAQMDKMVEMYAKYNPSQPDNARQMVADGYVKQPEFVEYVMANSIKMHERLNQIENEYNSFKSIANAQSQTVQEEFQRLQSGFRNAGRGDGPLKRVAPEALEQATGDSFVGRILN